MCFCINFSVLRITELFRKTRQKFPASGNKVQQVSCLWVGNLVCGLRPLSSDRWMKAVKGLHRRGPASLICLITFLGDRHADRTNNPLPSQPFTRNQFSFPFRRPQFTRRINPALNDVIKFLSAALSIKIKLSRERPLQELALSLSWALLASASKEVTTVPVSGKLICCL